MINPTSGVLTQYGTQNGMASNAGAFGIVAGPDHNLWFTETNIGKIGKINPTTGAITEYSSSNLASTSDPEGITVGPDGNLWFIEVGADKIGMITTAGLIQSYSQGMPANAI